MWSLQLRAIARDRGLRRVWQFGLGATELLIIIAVAGRNPSSALSKVGRSFV